MRTAAHGRARLVNGFLLAAHWRHDASPVSPPEIRRRLVRLFASHFPGSTRAPAWARRRPADGFDRSTKDKVPCRQEDQDCGEAPQSAREGACAPREIV